MSLYIFPSLAILTAAYLIVLAVPSVGTLAILAIWSIVNWFSSCD
jgi:hypothetical protein